MPSRSHQSASTKEEAALPSIAWLHAKEWHAREGKAGQLAYSRGVVAQRRTMHTSMHQDNSPPPNLLGVWKMTEVAPFYSSA